MEFQDVGSFICRDKPQISPISDEILLLASTTQSSNPNVEGAHQAQSSKQDLKGVHDNDATQNTSKHKHPKIKKPSEQESF